MAEHIQPVVEAFGRHGSDSTSGERNLFSRRHDVPPPEPVELGPLLRIVPHPDAVEVDAPIALAAVPARGREPFTLADGPEHLCVLHGTVGERVDATRRVFQEAISYVAAVPPPGTTMAITRSPRTARS